MNDKDLLRWALADQAFAEADELAGHLLKLELEQGSPLFAACCAGIASCYCRPFMGSNGMGQLPQEIKDLEKFDEIPHKQNFKKIHRMLRETRYKFGGHFDPVHAEQMHQRGELESSPGEVLIEFHRTTGAKVSVNLVHMDIRAIAFTRKLFAIQRARVGEKLGAYSVKLLEENAGEPGSRLIKVTF